MAIIGLGLDVVEIHRIEEALDKHGRRFKDRIFTKGEIERCEARADSAACFAARFAAKEAFYKALPNSVESTIPFKSVEIVNHENGNPEFRFSDAISKILKENGITRVHVSLTHSRILASAVVIME
jgi:holo-[acyl-carrier protein] synthase